jgi:hypothetical protein
MKRNTMSTDSLRNPCFGSSEVRMSFAYRIVSKESEQVRPDVKLFFPDCRSFSRASFRHVAQHRLVVRSAERHFSITA